MDKDRGIYMMTLNESRKCRQPQFLCRTGVVAVIAVICCALWGSAFPCIKIGYSMFEIAAGDIGSQILFAGIRFTLAGLFTVCFFRAYAVDKEDQRRK